jgi:hypothetical protein
MVSNGTICMTEEEKAKAYEELPEDLKAAASWLHVMSDSWSYEISKLMDAVLWHRDPKMLAEAKHLLAKKVEDSIAEAKDVGRLSTLPKEVLEELLKDLKQIDQWKWKVERMLYEAIRLQDKK